MSKQLGGFQDAPRKDSFAARVARAEGAAEGTIDVSELTQDEQAQLTKAAAIDKASQDFKFVPANSALERVEIVFDDSRSMGGEKISDAIAGVTEFMKSCIPNETAVRVTPLNADRHSAYAGMGSQVIKFTCNLPSIADAVSKFRATGGTPLYAKLKQALSNDERRNDLKPSRIIAFSDGQADEGAAYSIRPAYLRPDDVWVSEPEIHREVVSLAREFHIPIDTCYIASERSSYAAESMDSAEQTMRRIAEETGGIFIKFEKGKSSFARGFKYLTKGNRLLLTDAAFKSKVEAGEI